MSEKNNIPERIGNAGIIAIFRKLPPVAISPLAEALVNAGIRALELTVESEGAYEAIRAIRNRYGDELLIGAGTLMTRDELAQAVESGADFLLSPHFDAELVLFATELGVPMIPGVATPTEVVQANRAGAEVLKLFPATSLGSGYLKDLLGPFKGNKFIPTGGITVDNAADFIRAGALAVGMGSSLASKAEVDNQDWRTIGQRVRTALDRVRGAMV